MGKKITSMPGPVNNDSLIFAEKVFGVGSSAFKLVQGLTVVAPTMPKGWVRRVTIKDKNKEMFMKSIDDALKDVNDRDAMCSFQTTSTIGGCYVVKSSGGRTVIDVATWSSYHSGLLKRRAPVLESVQKQTNQSVIDRMIGKIDENVKPQEIGPTI